MTAKDPAERQRPPEAPPIQCSRDELHQWFAGLKVADADVTKYAVGIVQKHFAGAGLDVRPELTKATDWAGFAFYLSMMLGPLVDKDPKADWLRALLAELVDFSLINPSGSPAARLAQLLAQFIQWDIPRRGHFKALLPPQADPALQLIDEWEADERQRREEGYI
jgi:hypothetical protein